MNKFLTLLLLTHVVLGFSEPKTTMSSAVQSRFFVDITYALSSVISKKIEHLDIDDMKGEAKGYSYTLEDIDVDTQPIDPEKIGAGLFKGGVIKVDGTLSPMKGSARGRINIGFVTRNFGVSIGMNDLFFAMELQMKSVNNTLRMEITEKFFNLNKKDIHVKILGRLPSGLINVLSLQIRKLMAVSVGKKVKEIVTSEITKIADHVFNNLTGDFKITDQVFMKYEFPQGSNETDQRLTTKMVAYFHPFGNYTPPQNVTPVPLLNYNNSKKVQFFISESVIGSAIDTLFKLNLMGIQVAKEICGREANITCTVSELPRFRFARKSEANVTGVCGISLENSTYPDIRFSALLQLSLSESLRNSSVHFWVQNFTFSQLSFKAVAPIYIAWFKKAMNQTFGAIIEAVNERLWKKGMPLPVPEHVGYDDYRLDVGYGHMMAAIDPVFRIGHLLRADKAGTGRPVKN